MLTEIKDDIFYQSCDVLVHGCNCFNTMGGGVAYYVQKYYPEAYKADLNTIRGDKSKLGTFSYVDTYHWFDFTPITIINAYTQYSFASAKNPIAVDMDALKKVMHLINKTYPTQKIIMPKIGCGLAGGNWDEVKIIIEEAFANREIKVYYIE